jgi:hypothetical protein
MAEQRLVALRDRVRVIPTQGIGPLQARVRIETDGQRGEAEVDTGVPAADLGAQGDRLRRKFLALATPVLGAVRAGELCDAASSAEEMDRAADLLRLSQPG